VLAQRQAREASGGEPARPAGRCLPAPADELLLRRRAAGSRAVQRALHAGTIRSPAMRVPGQEDENPLDRPDASSSPDKAAAALQEWLGFSGASRHRCVRTCDKSNLKRLLAALSPDQVLTYRDAIRDIGRLVQQVETRAAAGTDGERVSDADIATELQDYLRRQAQGAAAAEAARRATAAEAAKKAAAATTAVAVAGNSARAPGPSRVPTELEVEAARKKLVASTTRISPPTRSGWAAMKPDEQASWTSAGNEAIQAVVKHAAQFHRELGLTADDFNLAFQRIEQRGANVLAFSESGGPKGNRAGIGFEFVRWARVNPAYVMDVVVHELFGHPEYGEYGEEYHLRLYDMAMRSMLEYVEPDDGTPERTAERDAYAYPETEIYARLRSFPYYTAPTAADAGKVPTIDFKAEVGLLLTLMKRLWPPRLIVPILRGYRMRLWIDPHITEVALKVFDDALVKTFDAATLALLKQ
jgi:hypothetical protein